MRAVWNILTIGMIFQTIASGMWTVLETILLGILLLYAAVSVQHCTYI